MNTMTVYWIASGSDKDLEAKHERFIGSFERLVSWLNEIDKEGAENLKSVQGRRKYRFVPSDGNIKAKLDDGDTLYLELTKHYQVKTWYNINMIEMEV